MTDKEFVLHRYFIWADRMRLHFDQELKKRVSFPPDKFELEVEEFMYMSLWYAQLYTVVEGWKEVGLTDSSVDRLLGRDECVELLRRYRNGVDHFQTDYFDSRFTNFVAQSGSALWVRDLHQALSGYFLRKLGEIPV